MSNSKIILSTILLCLSSTGFGQSQTFIYGGVNYFRDTGFHQNSYFNINAGSQLFRWKFIAPEVGFEYHFGRVKDKNEIHPEEPNARAPSRLNTRFSSQTLSVAPKLIIGNEEAAFIFIPQFNIGNINSSGNLLEDSGREYYSVNEQKFSENISFWSFAAGVEGKFFDSEVMHFSLLLKYHLLNTESILSQIDFEESRLISNGGSADGLGISFRVYFDIMRLIKEN